MTIRVAIVGAGGLIGRSLLKRLEADSKAVSPVAVVRNELTAAPLRAAGFDVRCGEITDEKQVEQLLGDSDVIVNCAAASSFWGQARRENRAVVDAVFSVKNPRTVIHFSSVAVYGSVLDSALNTFEKPRPDHPFGKEKFALEGHVRRRAREAGRRTVVIRLGHVYGVEQWVSRYVFEHLNIGWRLPFGGNYPSNAVHVSNVASAIRMLVGDERAEGTFNLFDPKLSTWRDVFDWNTRAIGVAPVEELDEASSERVRTFFRKRARTPVAISVGREVMAWLRAAPVSLVGSSPVLRDTMMSTAAALRIPEIDQRILAGFGRAMVRKLDEPLAVKEPWLLSDGALGPNLEYPAEISEADAAAVARWYRGWATPDTLAPFGDDDTRDVAVA